MSVLEETWSHADIVVNGIRLHFVTQGEGSLMLMLHGFPEFWYSWRHQIPEFAKEYKVVAPDLRGYNDSDKPQSLSAYSMSELIQDVKCLIQALGYKKCVLVAHDWGGSIAWQFAYEYPQMLDALIVMNAPHLTRFTQEVFKPQQLMRSWYIFLFQLPWLPELLLRAKDYQLIKGMLSGMVIRKETFTFADLEAFKNAAAKPGALTAMVNYYRNVFRPGNIKHYREVLNVSTLIIWGENDVALGKELTYGTESYVRDFQIKYIPNCSHWVQHEQPELVNRFIWNFLQKSKENL